MVTTTPVPADGSSPSRTFAAALAAVTAGLSIVPIVGDGSKRPAGHLLPSVWNETEQRFTRPWKPYTTRRPTIDELTAWFGPAGDPTCGFALVCGAISGDLEVMDFDDAGLFQPWVAELHRTRPGLVEKLVLVQSPRPGVHVYYRKPCAGSCRKLALAAVTDPVTGEKTIKTLIEVKGEGGLAIAPGSPADCHPTGRCYEFISNKGFADIPVVGIGDFYAMIQAAALLSRYRPPPRFHAASSAPSGPPRTDRPGDQFAAATSWSKILEPHRWTCISSDSSGAATWRRPGKTVGSSATTNYEGSDLLYVFSENAPPFSGNRAYNKFTAYALLNFGGDHHAAARHLVQQGFGAAAKKAWPGHARIHRLRRRRS